MTRHGALGAASGAYHRRNAGGGGGGGGGAGDSKVVALYNSNNLSDIPRIQNLLGRTFNTLLCFSGPWVDWPTYENPTYITSSTQSGSYAQWKAASPSTRQIIVSTDAMVLNEFPPLNYVIPGSTTPIAYSYAYQSNLGTGWAGDPSWPGYVAGQPYYDWLTRAANGDYNSHYTNFANNLVAGGLGDSVIRGPWEPTIGTCHFLCRQEWTSAQDAKWIQGWRNWHKMMSQVNNNTFLFDWNTNGWYTSKQLSTYYPGDDVVDIIGMDVYDLTQRVFTGAAAQRWSDLMSGTGSTAYPGIQNQLDFAALHNKPFSFPEFALIDPTVKNQDGTLTIATGGADDPTYINGIASAALNNPCAYVSYFWSQIYYNGNTSILTGDGLGASAPYNGSGSPAMVSAPNSLAAYRSAFSDSRFSTGPVTATVGAPITTGQPVIT